MSVVTERTNLHRLVELLPDADLDTIARIMQGLIVLQSDPLLQNLAEALEDDEPITEEDLAAEAEAEADMAAGRILPHDEAKRTLLEPE